MRRIDLQSKGSKAEHGNDTDGAELGGSACGLRRRSSGRGGGAVAGSRGDGDNGGLNGGLNSGRGRGLSGGLRSLSGGLRLRLRGGRLGLSLRGGGLGLSAGVLTESLGGGEHLVCIMLVTVLFRRVDMTRLTKGNVGTAGLNHTAGGSTLDGGEGILHADAGVVGGAAVALALDGIVDAGNGALGDVRDGLGTRDGGKGNGGESVLHLEGIKRVVEVDMVVGLGNAVDRKRLNDLANG